MEMCEYDRFTGRPGGGYRGPRPEGVVGGGNKR